MYKMEPRLRIRDTHWVWPLLCRRLSITGSPIPKGELPKKGGCFIGGLLHRLQQNSSRTIGCNNNNNNNSPKKHIKPRTSRKYLFIHLKLNMSLIVSVFFLTIEFDQGFRAHRITSSASLSILVRQVALVWPKLSCEGISCWDIPRL